MNTKKISSALFLTYLPFLVLLSYESIADDFSRQNNIVVVACGFANWIILIAGILMYALRIQSITITRHWKYPFFFVVSYLVVSHIHYVMFLQKKEPDVFGLPHDVTLILFAIAILFPALWASYSLAFRSCTKEPRVPA
jgi:hypothetical protein